MIIPWLPDYLLFLFVFIVALVIYYYLPDELKSGIRRFVVGYGFYIVLFLLWLYYRNQWGVVADYEFWGQMKYATFLTALVLGLYLGFKMWLFEFRYYTNQAIANNDHGSCHRYHEIGDWAILFIGGSGTSDEKFVFPWPWVKKIWVVPKVAVQFVGNQIFVRSQIDKVDLFDVPGLEEVAEFIGNDPFGRWCKEKIYFGLWDEQVKATNPKYAEIESINKKLNARVNELNTMLKGKLTSTKQFISDTFAMQDKIIGKRWQRREQPREE